MIAPLLCLLFALAILSLLRSLLALCNEMAAYTEAVCEGRADFPPSRTIERSDGIPF